MRRGPRSRGRNLRRDGGVRRPGRAVGHRHGRRGGHPLAGLDHFTGKIVLDASDPLDFSSGRPGLFVGTTDSLGERIQRLIPRAFVVKGLNIVLADVMINPSLTGGEPDMFIAGNSEEAKQTVTTLLAEFGWPVVDLGASRARAGWRR